MFYRTKLNITQEELANLVGVTRQTIISLEQGRYNPSLELAHKITKALRQKKIENIFIL
jgi:putative transcriptional regulator